MSEERTPYGDKTPCAGGSEHAPATSLSTKHLLATFEYSQGSFDLQLDLCLYLKVLHPALRLSAGEQEALYAASIPLVHAITSRPERHMELFVTSFDLTMQVIAKRFDEAVWPFIRPASDQELISRIAYAMLRRDARYFELGGRPRKPSQIPHYNPHRDPWLSHICYYGLLGQPTGLPEFDLLFREVAQFCTMELSQDSEESQTLRAVISTWNQRHPDMLVSL